MPAATISTRLHVETSSASPMGSQPTKPLQQRRQMLGGQREALPHLDRCGAVRQTDDDDQRPPREPE